MIESFEHLQIYESIIKDYLKKKNITDYSKFKVALSHDKPHFLKWEYTGIDRPTEEYLAKEFKIDLSVSGKNMSLGIKFIYINNPEIFKQATNPATGIDSKKLRQPIYFTVDGDIVDQGTIKMNDQVSVNHFKRKASIESIIKIDVESPVGFWTNGNKDFLQRLSLDNGLLKYTVDMAKESFVFEHPPSVIVRVLVVYQKYPQSKKASEIQKTSTVLV